MRSGSAIGLAAVSLALAGCSTTMDEAARLQLNDARIRATEVPLSVGGRQAAVQIAGAALVSGHGRSAVVVTLRNRSATAISDLPVLVGAVIDHRPHYLNRDVGLDYFQTHVPAIAAGGVLRWVLSVGRALPPGTPVFARLGAPAPGLSPAIRALPAVHASGRANALTVTNASDVPQYQLPVYAVALRGRRLVAAGQTLIGHLGTGASARLKVSLVGEAARSTLTLQAPPTTFR